MLLRWRVDVGLGLRVGIGWMTLASAAWSAPPVAERPGVVAETLVATATNPNALRLSVSEAVLGILAHTRWPQRAAQQPLLLSLCVNERSRAAPDLRTLPDRLSPGRLAPVRLIGLADPVPLDCDAVFLGSGPGAAEPLGQLIGRPVLSVGEGAEFCSRGGMFCLIPHHDDLRVEVNLDTVARSGLHVHPQVLKLGQPRPEARP